MDRKGIIAIAIAFATLIAWMVFNQREMQKASAAQAQQRAAVAREKAAVEAANPPPEVTPPPAAPVPKPIAEAPTPEEIGTVTTPSVEYSFSNLGGSIVKAALRKHEAEQGTRMFLNDFGSVPIGAVTFQAGEETRAPFTGSVDAIAGVATFERTGADQLQVTKKFELPRAGDPEEYRCTLSVTFTNRADKAVVTPGYFVSTGSAAPIHQRDQGIYTGFTYDGSPKFIDVTWFSAGGMFGFGHPERPVFSGQSQPPAGVRWAGVTNQYFTTIVSPAGPPLGAAVWARRFTISDEAWQAAGRSHEGQSGARYGIDGALGMPAFTLEPGQSLAASFHIYTGPREYSRLKLLGGDQEKIMDFGTFAIVSKTLLNSMNWLNARLGSYAAAIIVLTIFIKLFLWPWQNKATQSMKRMSLLQPKMTEIREKHADDPQKMNAEIMKLYKDFGVNPFGGCLPMLIQIPIFFGFYNMLGKAVELRNSKFLWVGDLSQPDTVAYLPGLGIPINVLPLLMAATMLWSMAISPKSGDVAQQRMFMFMPLIFVFFCYNFASALALYWTVQNLFSVAQLYATRNQAPPQLQKVAAPRKK